MSFSVLHTVRISMFFEFNLVNLIIIRIDFNYSVRTSYINIIGFNFNITFKIYFSVAVFSLTIIAALSGKDMLNGLIAGLTGIALSMVGMAPIDTKVRYTFGNYQLLNGFDITVLLIGVFAVTDIILAGFGRRTLAQRLEQKKYQLKGYGISMIEFIQQIPNAIISSIIGIVIGILPGIGGSTAGLLAYTAEKSRSKHPEKFGTGIIDGVIASETSNNKIRSSLPPASIVPS